MIAGINRYCEHQGQRYHIQVEDLGDETACFEIKVYSEGQVLWLKRLPYRGILARQLPRLEQEEALRGLIEKAIRTVQAAILRGRLEGSSGSIQA